MLSIKTGHDVGYLTNAVAQAREGYYTGAVATGEPPGLWWGAGAEALGLTGEVDADLMEAVYTHLLDPRDPASHARSTWGEAPALAAGHRKYRSASEIYDGLLEAEPFAGAERRAELLAQAERSARQAVSFIDMTFSAPKSVTVLAVSFERAANDAAAAGDYEAAAAWSMHAEAVEAAVMAGATAALEYVQHNAGYSRVGHHGGGAGRWIDAHSFVAAQFLQHDRDKDPQLHVHQAILNRVLCADGEWRSLDSRAIHTLRGAAGAIAERVMEAHLTRSLGVDFATRPDGKAREIRGVPQEVMDLFSSRRRAVSARTSELLADFRAANGREPTPAERYYIAQQATLATRRGKSHDGETREEQIARWTEQCRDLIAGGLAQVAADVLARAQQASLAADWSPRDVVARALAAVSDAKSAWSRSALVRAVSDALPGNLRIQPEQVEALLDGLADSALEEATAVTQADDVTNLPASELLANVQSPYTSPTGALYTTEGQFTAEHAIRAAAVERGAVTLPVEVADRLIERYAESGVALGADQEAVLRSVLTSGAQVEVLVAAAGTGKSFVLGAIADAWRHGDPDTRPADPETGEAGETGADRRVFGLAPYQVAADILGREGLNSRNVASWLAAQRRLDNPRPPGSGGEVPDEPWRLRPGDLVVVDEAGTADVGSMREIIARSQAAGAKVISVGDPRQLGAIGPGGALADLAVHGIVHQLTEVRRFLHDWEGPASLRLRDGDVTVLDEYAKHGRLVDGGTTEQAETAAARAYLADVLNGKESLLMVGTNVAAARVSAELRAEMVALGRVEERGVELGMDDWQGVTAGVGDLVQARALAWHLRGFEGNTAAPITRQTYRVTGLRADGGLTVAPIVERRSGAPANEAGGGWNVWGERLGTPMQLPPSYVREHLSLGYAVTRDSAQGGTVDTGHAVTGGGTTAAGVYVPGTRGRESNTFYVVTRELPEDAPTGETLTAPERPAQAVLADALTAEAEDRTALAQREQADLDARSTMTHVDRLIDVVARHVTAGRLSATLDRLAAEGTLSARDRERIAADEAFGSLERLLRTAELAGHDPDAVIEAAVTDDRGLQNAASPARVLHCRITDAYHGRLTPNVTDLAELVPADTAPEWAAYLRDRVAAATERRHELGAEIAEQAPEWAVVALGPVPDSGTDVLGRQEWERRAGWAGAYRELVGYDDERDPLGDAPAPAMAEKAALFRAAHRELGLLDMTAEEANLTEGQLRARVVGYQREEVWAPRFVEPELDATTRRLEEVRADATIWRARAAAPDTSAEDAEQLRDAAAAAEREAANLEASVVALEEDDHARAVWFAHTADSREKCHRARTELRARGIDPDDPDDRVTAEEWLDAHRAEQDKTDHTREIHEEYELVDVAQRDEPAAPDRFTADEEVLEPALADIRDTATPDPAEREHPAARRRIVPRDETTEAVAKAQDALAEITRRQQADAERAAREAEENTRLIDLTRWQEQSADADEHADEADLADEPVLER